MTTCSLRGDSWNNSTHLGPVNLHCTHFGPANLHCRSASRGCDFSECTDSETGFRVVCTSWRKPVRGGSIYGSTTALRSATRGFTPMALDISIMGFRVVCLPPEVTP